MSGSRKFLSYYHTVKGRLLKFAVVGISGIVVNIGLLAVFTELITLSLKIAGAIAIGTSILSNFLLNNFWTWQDSHEKSFLKRLVQYLSVSSIAGFINWIILIILTYFGLNHFVADLFGIAFATLINFILNNHWTFAKNSLTE